MVDNILLILLILIYITFVLVINIFMSLKSKTKEIKRIEKKDIPAKLLYCYGINSSLRLFKVTMLDLVNRGYYSLVKKDDSVIIKYNKDNKDNHKLTNSEKRVIEITNDCLNEKEVVTLKELDEYFSADWNYSTIISEYYTELKKEIITTYGVLDKALTYIGTFLISFLYSLQVVYFFNYSFKLKLFLILSIILSIITVFVTKMVNKRIVNITKKKYIIVYFISIILSVCSFYIWKNDSSNNYIIFHIVNGLLTYMYPLLVYTNLLFVKKNKLFRNKKQEEVCVYLNSVKEYLLNKDNYSKNDYIYLFGFNINNNIEDITNKFVK